MTTVYLSSTFSDLEAHRREVYDVLRQLRHDVRAMEHYVAKDERPVDACLADVAACDVYVGIFALRYGFVPPHDNPEQLSITELEYRKAAELGRPRLIFLLKEDALWPPICIDGVTGENGRGDRIAALRAELALERTVSFFSSPSELTSQVSVAMREWERSQGDAGVIPLPPRAESPDWEFPDLNSNRGWLVEAVQIERSTHRRQDIAERLQSEHWGRRYLRMLEAVLGLAERIWGPRGSSQAFIMCVFFSLAYAYVLFWLSITGGWNNPFGDIAGFGEVSGLVLNQRLLLFGLFVLSPVALWWLARCLACWLQGIEQLYKTPQKRRPTPQTRWCWFRLYWVIFGLIVLVFFGAYPLEEDTG